MICYTAYLFALLLLLISEYRNVLKLADTMVPFKHVDAVPHCDVLHQCVLQSTLHMRKI